MSASISIIIPVYNGSKTIEKTLRTALNQDYDNYEVIVVNDCSIDNTLEILQSINDPKLKIISFDKNQGRSHARNYGIEAATSDYIAMLDADDLIFPQKLRLQMDYILKNDLDISGTWAYGVDGKGVRYPYCHPVSDKQIKNTIIKSNAFVQSTIMGKRTVFLEFGGYDASLAGPEDYDLYLKIAKKYKVGNCPEFLAEYLLPSGVKYLFKEQLNTAKVRLNAIFNYGYSKTNFLFVFSPLIVGLIPRVMKLRVKSFLSRRLM